MTQTEALKLALEALENNKQKHHYCEDTWYSCPKHEDGCANESEGDECNCGADEINARFDKAITAIKEALAQPEHEKERCVGCEACIDTACGRDECPKGWPKAAQPEQEPAKLWCETCEGTGEVYQEHQVGCYVGGHFKCHDCDGEGHIVSRLYSTTPPQRKPLDIKTIKRIATYCGEHITDEDVIEITRRVEEEHKIKE